MIVPNNKVTEEEQAPRRRKVFVLGRTSAQSSYKSVYYNGSLAVMRITLHSCARSLFCT